MPWWKVVSHPRGKTSWRDRVASRLIAEDRPAAQRQFRRENKGKVIDRIRKD